MLILSFAFMEWMIAQELQLQKIFFLGNICWLWNQWKNTFALGVAKFIGSGKLGGRMKLNKTKKIANHDVWLDVKTHCGKSHRPFECFANENHKHGNEWKPTQHLRDDQLQISRCNRFSAETKDASAWRISMTPLSLLMTVVHNDSLCCTKRKKKKSSRRCPWVMTCSCCVMWVSVSHDRRWSRTGCCGGCSLEQPASLGVIVRTDIGCSSGTEEQPFHESHLTTLFVMPHQWSPKACQTWREIGFMRQTLCNPISWHKCIHSQPTWRNDLLHHLARQPNQCGQNLNCQKLRPVCQRQNCNSWTIQIHHTTSHQLWQWNLWRPLPVDTCHISIDMQSWPPPAMMSHSMTKEPAQHKSCERFCCVQCLTGCCLTGSTVRTNKKKLFSIYFQSTSLRNTSNNLL